MTTYYDSEGLPIGPRHRQLRGRIQGLRDEEKRLERLMQDLDYEPPAEKPKDFKGAREAAERRINNIGAWDEVMSDPELGPMAQRESLALMLETALEGSASPDPDTYRQAAAEIQGWAQATFGEDGDGT